MRKTLLVIISIIATCYFYLIPPRVVAQNLPQRDLVVIPYTTISEFYFIFTNSAQVLNYYDADELEETIILALITTDQKQTIEKKGIRVQLIEENADMADFTYLYNPLKDQAHLLAGLGTVYPITPYHTLVKPNQNNTIVTTGELSNFTLIPLFDNYAQPTLTTKKAQASKTTALSQTPSSKSKSTTFMVSLVIILILIMLLLYFRSRSRDSQPPPTPEIQS